MTRFGSLLVLTCLACPLHAEPIRIITLGDSITRGVRPGVTAEQTFSALLEKTLRRQGLDVQVTNSGVGSETTTLVLKRLKRDALDKKPHLVTVMYGTNDCYIDRGKTTQRVPLAEFEKNLVDIVDQLQKAGIQPVLMTEPAYAENGPKTVLGEDTNIGLGKYMNVTRALAADRKLPLVDNFGHWMSLMARKKKLGPWTTDGYHLNPAGNEDAAHRIAQVLLPLVQRLADKHNAWDDKSPFRVQLDAITSGYDGAKCWVHPRAGILGDSPGSVVLTMHKLLLKGSDVFDPLADLRSDDVGKSWSPIRVHENEFARRNEPKGVEVGVCDFTPKWHAKTGKLLNIGQTVRYVDNAVMEKRQRETAYTVYDAKTRTWTPFQTIVMPNNPKFYAAGAGSAQRVDLPGGDILLPVYFKGKEDPYYSVTVARCSFDGTTLKYLEHGDEFSVKGGRGLFEPSLTKFKGKYYLTMRNESAGYVSVGDDGLHFSQPKIWQWHDSTPLPTYNTQQHWVTHADALYLVYTRKGSHNDHVFRHRAPLFIAQVDPEKLQVLRDTEKIAVPEHGARLGNFGVVDVNENESWITVAEWMQTWSPNIVIAPDNVYGGANRIYAARLHWHKPNKTWTER